MSNKTSNLSSKTSVSAADVHRYLGGIDYPASKMEMIDYARDKGADDEVIEALNLLPEIEYEGPTDVSREIGKAM